MADQQKVNEPAAPVRVFPVKFIHRNEDRIPTFHAEGAWVIANPQGFIRMGFYTENSPMPSVVIQPVNEDGTPKGDAQVVGIDEPNFFVLMRDFQCNVVVSLAAAIQIHAALGNYIKIARQQMEQQIMEMGAQLKEAEQKKSSVEKK